MSDLAGFDLSGFSDLMGGGGSGGGGGFDWGGLLGGVGGLFNSAGNIAGGIWGNNQAKSDQQILQQAYGFNGSRPMYADKLNTLMADPSSITKDPGYQFRMDQAMQGSSRQMAAQGLTGSGTAAQALTDTGSKVAGDEFKSMFDMLSGLSGANFNPADYFKGMMSTQQSQQNAAGQAAGGGGDMLGSLFDIGSKILPFFL
jgi:hypothetical protein